MKDIARLTGLGLATISSYFNGGNVREKNRVKIEKAIEELHYEVNEVARGLKTNATKTIGVVIPELNNIFCAEIITGMEDILRSHGYATIVCDCRTDKKLEQEAVEFLIRRRVDGIINMPVDETGAHLKRFQKTGKPIVLIDRKIQGIPCDSVLVDNKKAAEDADIIVTTGGVSVGKKDILHGALEILGAEKIFWRIRLQPGTPTIFSVYGKTLILSLSGNPFGAMANLELILRPALETMTGDSAFAMEMRRGIMEVDFEKRCKVRRFVRAVYKNGKVSFPQGIFSSGAIGTLRGCNCLLDIPAGRENVKAGEQVAVWML